MLEVLYIEDNADESDIFRRLISRMEQPPSFLILTSGSEAIDYLLEQGDYKGKSPAMPHLVLIDLKLPGHSGFDVIQQVRANSRTRYMPLVVYSSSDNPKDMRRAYDLGANAYLIKPESYHQVSDMISQAINFWLIHSQQFKP
ncbi:response regulator [Spirosoma pollinicola]|uniref:Response regulator n=1 Tax=Spirosoma pollinicola TaxID=2057025 RepID=A0A2K8YS24_9BACT|nr:response regulator [Spirosoma pollinicola]AUD00422.1 response regulator [Spirosoma pollinicola]